MQIRTPKTYYKDSNFILEYEIIENKPVLHCNVEHFNTRVLRKMYNVFVNIQKDFAREGFTEMYTVTPNPKFCELFNGIRKQKFMHEGKEYEVVVWELV